jgi:hydroxymethylglutaryl-CoA reductase (NADPH)
MPISNSTVNAIMKKMLGKGKLEDYVKNLAFVSPQEKPLPKRIPGKVDWSKEAQQARRKVIAQVLKVKLPYLTQEEKIDDPSIFRGNIENLVGLTQVPTAVIGPLRVNGLYAKGDFYIPLATTEGALAASYQRGAWITSLCGGVRTICSSEQVQRAPCFIFRDAIEAGQFILWATKHFAKLKKVISERSRHAKLEEMRVCLNGNWVYLIFGYNTGDAAGQNMVTLCTEVACQYIVKKCPIKPVSWFVEGNLSGDKKATAASFVHVRGKMVTAEVVIRKDLVRKVLGTTPERMVQYWTVSAVGGIQAGSIGVQGHFANGLAAIFLACGQDVACVAEAAVGITRMALESNGNLYISTTLPNLIVGTVGGGTRLPTQRECLAIMGCEGEGHAKKFAEICAATALAGEVSIIGALAAGEFAGAHAKYGRPKPPEKKGSRDG